MCREATHTYQLHAAAAYEKVPDTCVQDQAASMSFDIKIGLRVSTTQVCGLAARPHRVCVFSCRNPCGGPVIPISCRNRLQAKHMCWLVKPKKGPGDWSRVLAQHASAADATAARSAVVPHGMLLIVLAASAIAAHCVQAAALDVDLERRLSRRMAARATACITCYSSIPIVRAAHQ
jgi:hypothetical protein